MYDAIIGRFFSEDPLRSNSDDYNLYRYVLNDPVNSTDPSGLGKGKVVGYVVRRVGDALVRGRRIATTAGATACFLRGSDVLITRGRSAAQAIARRIQGALGKKAGAILEHQGHRLPGGGVGRPHFQFDDIPGQHIFYGGLAALLAYGAGQADAAAPQTIPGTDVSLADCDVVIDEVYEYTMERDSLFNALTFTYWFGEDSPASYADWVNPLELIAIGGQFGRDIDRYITMKLTGVIVTAICKDGSETAFSVGVDGELFSVTISKDGKSVTTSGADFQQQQDKPPANANSGR